MTKAFKTRLMGGALGLIAVFSAAAWAETPVPADLAQEDAYLDVLPKVDVPENVEPIPGAVNEEFRNCETSWPEGYALARSGPEARALRDIYGTLLHKLGDGRTAPGPEQTYPATFVTGMPSAV